MRRRHFLKLTTALAGGIALAGCAQPGPYVEAQAHVGPWYEYYYYPYSDIYLEISTGLFFYFDDGVWLRVSHLPSYIYLDRRGRREYRYRDRRPWRHHHDHRRDFERWLRSGTDWYEYYYYPYSDIYFHIGTGFYFYFLNGSWRRVRRLPPHLHLDRRGRRRYRMREDRPWVHRDRHRNEFERWRRPSRRSDDDQRRRREEEERRRREESGRRRREEADRREREERRRRREEGERREREGRRREEDGSRRRRQDGDQPRSDPPRLRSEPERRDGQQQPRDRRGAKRREELRRRLERWRRRREDADR